MDTRTRIMMSPEQLAKLDEPVNECVHRRTWLILITSKKYPHGELYCLGCGTFFEFLFHIQDSVMVDVKEQP